MYRILIEEKKIHIVRLIHEKHIGIHVYTKSKERTFCILGSECMNGRHTRVQQTRHEARVKCSYDARMSCRCCADVM
jgi:hypothetical protein